ncbi:MAG: TorF family putative porin [Pseudomonadota bacterium]
MRSLAAFGLLFLPSLGHASDFEVTGLVSGVTDYRDRGISLSTQLPSFKSRADVSHSSGFFFGSSFNTVNDPNGGDIEFQPIAGYSRDIGIYFVEAGIEKTVIVGGTTGTFAEGFVTLGADVGLAVARLRVLWSPNDIQPGSRDNVYVEARADGQVPNTQLVIRLRAGYESLSLGGDKVDWELTLSHAFGPIDLAVSYTDSTVSELAGQDGGATGIFSIRYFF